MPEGMHARVPMRGLDHERAVRPQYAAELAKGPSVFVLAAVTERGEEAEHRVEASCLEGQLAVIRLNPARPLALAGTPACLLE